MKRLIVIMLLITASLYSKAQIAGVDLTASGLTCSMCSNAIYKALKKLPFVDTVKADIESSSFAVTFKKDKTPSLDVLQKAVEDAGFSIAVLQLKANFDKVNVKNDAMIEVDGQSLHFLNVANQTLTGMKTLTLVDKHFTSDKMHKKFAQYTAMKCYDTGVMQACCNKEGTIGKRIYHVTI